MNDTQKQVIKLLDNATPHSELQKWPRGFIPEHYKRLSIPKEEALALAKLGFKKSYRYFGTKLFFTQAMLLGAVLEGKYKTFVVVTPSQYGKSYLCGQIALLRANLNHRVYVAGGNNETSKIIMTHVIDHLQTIDSEIKEKLLESANKIEKTQTAVSKKKIALKGGGFVEGISLGETFNDAKRANAAIGRGGDYIVDEASLISDDTYAEMGRREVASVNGEKFLSFEISNPHNPGRFFDRLTAANPPKDTLIVWMDVRTAVEEGRYTKEKVPDLEFFQHKSHCKRYLLCELEDYSEESLFDPVPIDDSLLTDDLTFCLGVDSAYKGKDSIEAVLSTLDSKGHIRVVDHVTIKKDNWIDGVTGDRVIQSLLKIIHRYQVKRVCVDVGFGVYISEGLASRAVSFRVTPISFGGGVTPYRKELGHYAAKYGSNMRAELHLNLAYRLERQMLTMTTDMQQALQEQMNAVRAIRTTGNGKEQAKTAIIPKDQIKRQIGKSPDQLDATLLSIHAAILCSLEQKVLLYAD